MFNKKNIKLFILLFVLILAAWVYMVPWQNFKKEGNYNFLAKVNIDQINRIEATKPSLNKDELGEVFVLVKTGDTWQVAPDNLPTETIIIDALIDKLNNLTKVDFEVASINPEKKSLFKVDEEGLRVKLFQGENEVASFIIGKVANDYQSSFIGQEGDDYTYRVKDTFVRAFDVDSWKDKTIFDIDSANINTLVFKYPTSETEITNKPDSRGESYWRSVKPLMRLSEEKVIDVINSLAKLEASEIPTQTISGTGLEKNSLIVTIKGNGIEESLIVGDAYKDGQYFAKKVSNGQIFLIPEAIKDVLYKKYWELR